MNILPSRKNTKYLKTGRLPDVLALIQVLALDPMTYRSETGNAEEKVLGLQGELQGIPASESTWTAIAKEHPEFFRVNIDRESAVSLVARHVIPKNEKGKRVLPNEFVGKLLELAVDLHDRQIKLAERWTYLIPIWASLIGALVILYKS
jgi:hypothetical protein